VTNAGLTTFEELIALAGGAGLPLRHMAVAVAIAPARRSIRGWPDRGLLCRFSRGVAGGDFYPVLLQDSHQNGEANFSSSWRILEPYGSCSSAAHGTTPN
jgi:hypothetical protein